MTAVKKGVREVKTDLEARLSNDTLQHASALHRLIRRMKPFFHCSKADLSIVIYHHIHFSLACRLALKGPTKKT